MPIWNRIRDEVERATRAAHSAIDEGKLRLDLMRARQAADRAAQRLGYAVFKARKDGGEIAPDVYNRHASELASSQAEIARLETLLKEAAARRSPSTPGQEPPAEPAAAEPAPAPPEEHAAGA